MVTHVTTVDHAHHFNKVSSNASVLQDGKVDFAKSTRMIALKCLVYWVLSVLIFSTTLDVNVLLDLLERDATRKLIFAILNLASMAFVLTDSSNTSAYVTQGLLETPVKST